MDAANVLEGLGRRTEHWHRLEDGRVQCDVCPRRCRLREGQRGFCFVRMRRNDAVVLTTYGRSSGFCVDPIEKKPLNHFLPGTAVLSFGTAGCNLACRFCQNWDISKSREVDTLADAASPERIAQAARDLGCRSVAFTYNEPVIFMEYAIDVARACHELGVKAVAVTAGYVNPDARVELFRHMDAANVDLKAFGDDFYHSICAGHLAPVLETLEYLKHETNVWLEITNLLIPGLNDSNEEIDAMTRWVVERLGPDVPMHFTAFHPAWKMHDPDAAGVARAGPIHRHGERRAPRVHGQRPRPPGSEHPVRRVRRAPDRARRVRAGGVESRRGRPLRRVRGAVRRGVRGIAGNVGRTEAAGAVGGSRARPPGPPAGRLRHLLPCGSRRARAGGRPAARVGGGRGGG